ncbi:hypothetical protein Tcan_18688 [Toxocara canis]|uniref:Uncharacterized protein n=1 Tax=Toxocara canis TaxID=6265 RepID=A0A0B2URP9_TOXCA|nr:hypothetical protein Tcan_18688 [Toxocara canis]
MIAIGQRQLLRPVWHGTREQFLKGRCIDARCRWKCVPRKYVNVLWKKGGELARGVARRLEPVSEVRLVGWLAGVEHQQHGTMYLSWWWLLVLLICSRLRRSWLVEAWRHNHSSCHGCAEARDQFAKIRLEQIKREILEKLGLDGPPQVRPSEGFPSIPQVAKYLKSQVRRDIHSSFLADEPSYAVAEQQKTEQTIIIAERAPARYNQNWPVGHFRFSQEIMSKWLRRAFLYVFIRKPSTLHLESHIGTIQVIVREVLKDAKVVLANAKIPQQCQ